MRYKKIESKLKTNKSRNYLWNRMNTINKIIKIEGFPKNSKYKKISENNYECQFGKRFTFLTFIPKSGFNMFFVYEKDMSLAWFEIKGEKNCTIIHGNHVRVDNDKGKWHKDHFKSAQKHFMEELQEIAK